MPTHHDDIEKDQYEKINSLAAKVEGLTAAVDISNQLNIETVKLLKKALSYEFWTIIVLIAALVYGAIGKDGLFAVRQAVPVPTVPALPQGDQQAVIAPWHNDFDRHTFFRRLKTAA